MSCIRFNTPAQRQQRAQSASALLPPELSRPELSQSELSRSEALRSAGPVAQFLSPAITASKIARIRRLAQNPNPKIRESAASSYHAPLEVFENLSRDPDPGVRACIAKNEYVPCDILRRLADDPDERVRGFIAINFFVPADAMQVLADDSSPMVRGLVHWKASLAEVDDASLEPSLTGGA